MGNCLDPEKQEHTELYLLDTQSSLPQEDPTYRVRVTSKEELAVLLGETLKSEHQKRTYKRGTVKVTIF